MSKAPRKIGRKPARKVIPRVVTNGQGQIPLSEQYGCGITPVTYHLEQAINEFGHRNIVYMLDMLAHGQRQAVIDMLAVWKVKRYGHKFDMLDESMGINSAYGLTAATAIKNGTR